MNLQPIPEPMRDFWCHNPFGSEQASIQSRWPVRLLYRLIGEFRFPLRLRAYYLRKALPTGFQPEKVWDAGCGDGHSSFYLARRYPQAEVLGTDMRRESVGRCQRIAQQSGLYNVSFWCSDLVADPAASPQGCDLIVCFEVLEHIHDFQNALCVLAGSLKAGGLLLIHTPAAGRFQSATYGLRRYFQEADHRDPEAGQYHVRLGFELSALAKAVENAGLTVIQADYTFGSIAMLAHTIYEVMRSRSKLGQLSVLPALMAIGWLDAQRKHPEGGGLLLAARR